MIPYFQLHSTIEDLHLLPKLPHEFEVDVKPHVPRVYLETSGYLPIIRGSRGSQVCQNILLKARTRGRPFFLAYRIATFSSLFMALSTSSDGPPFLGSAREKRDPCQSSK